jgi:hypothetical protein
MIIENMSFFCDGDAGWLQKPADMAGQDSIAS